MRGHLLLALGLALCLPAPSTRAADPRYPDWPCQQAKVPEISVAAIWAGPPLGDAEQRWRETPGLPELATRLAARRTSMDEAESLINDYVTGSPEERAQKGKLLFTAVFDNLNQQRFSVLQGLERVTRRLRESAQKIRSDTLELQRAQATPDADEAAKTAQLTEQVQWETRIYDERRRMLRYVCEVPVAIDQRLFALGRKIQDLIEE